MSETPEVEKVTRATPGGGAIEALIRSGIMTQMIELWRFSYSDLTEELQTCGFECLVVLYETLIRMKQEREDLPKHQKQLLQGLLRVKRVEFVEGGEDEVVRI
jgi:hypothetical protein